LELIP
jgi:alpha-tubulin suppressor-like RCC1 family protein